MFIHVLDFFGVVFPNFLPKSHGKGIFCLSAFLLIFSKKIQKSNGEGITKGPLKSVAATWVIPDTKCNPTCFFYTFNRELLHSASLSSSAEWRQAEATDTAACSDSGAQNIFRVQIIAPLSRNKSICTHSLNQHWMLRVILYHEIVWIEVSFMHVCRFVSSMSVLNDKVKQLFEDFI